MIKVIRGLTAPMGLLGILAMIAIVYARLPVPPDSFEQFGDATPSWMDYQEVAWKIGIAFALAELVVRYLPDSNPIRRANLTRHSRLSWPSRAALRPVWYLVCFATWIDVLFYTNIALHEISDRNPVVGTGLESPVEHADAAHRALRNAMLVLAVDKRDTGQQHMLLLRGADPDSPLSAANLIFPGRYTGDRGRTTVLDLARCRGDRATTALLIRFDTERHSRN